MWLGFENGNLITLNESVNFDLQVKVDIRGTGTEGVLSFEGAFYVSDKSELDDTAVEVRELSLYLKYCKKIKPCHVYSLN